METRNIVERLENLIAANEQAQDALREGVFPSPSYIMACVNTAINDIETANGIAGEILTMIDGR